MIKQLDTKKTPLWKWILVIFAETWNTTKAKRHLPEYYPIGRPIYQGPCPTIGLRPKPSFPSTKVDVFEVRRTKCGNVSKIRRNSNFPGNRFCEVVRRLKFELHVTEKKGANFQFCRRKISSNRSLSDLFVVLEWPLPIFEPLRLKLSVKSFFHPMGWQFDKEKTLILWERVVFTVCTLTFPY